MKSLIHRLRRLWLPVAGAVLLVSGIAAAPLGFASADQRQPPQNTSSSRATPWVATWGASPQDMGNHNYTGTIRNIVFAAPAVLLTLAGGLTGIGPSRVCPSGAIQRASTQTVSAVAA